MAPNTLKCNHFTPLGLKELTLKTETRPTRWQFFCRDETETRHWYVSRPSQELRPRPPWVYACRFVSFVVARESEPSGEEFCTVRHN